MCVLLIPSGPVLLATGQALPPGTQATNCGVLAKIEANVPTLAEPRPIPFDATFEEAVNRLRIARHGTQPLLLSILLLFTLYISPLVPAGRAPKEERKQGLQQLIVLLARLLPQLKR